MKKLVMALVPFLVFGCGGEPEDANGDGIADGVQDPNNVSVVVPATPKGTVSGQVLTTQQKPLPGASVALTIGSATVAPTTTDENGNFSFKDVPGGAQVLLTFSKDGFASLRASSVVPDSAGNVPINNGNASFGPVLLSELNGSVKFILIGPDGRPAANARGTLEVNPAGRVLFGLSEETTSRVVVEATSDGSGVISFDRVPTPIELERLNGSYLLSVAAVDGNGDGVFESGGLVKSYEADVLIKDGNFKVEQLPAGYDQSNGLFIKYSNLGYLAETSGTAQANMIKPGDSIFIVFNQPVQPNSVVVGLTDEYGKENLAITKTLAGGNTILTLNPGQITAGREYNLYIRAVSVGGDVYSVSSSIPFFAGEVASPQPISVENIRFQDVTPNGTTIVNNRLDQGELVHVNFNQVMSSYGAQRVQLYINADLDGNGTIGNAVGEVGYSGGVGFPLLEDEPIAPIRTRTPAERPVFPILRSGYTTRFSFTYNGTRPLDPAAFPGGLSVVLSFSTINDRTADGIESGWGVTQTSDLNASVFASSAIPPPAPAAP